MRRTYISPEFNYNKVFGTFNMLEQSTFFGSKMLDIADQIEIKNENLIYFQQTTGEQINQTAELLLPQIIYDTVTDKRVNHLLILDESQSPQEKFNNTRWILDINLNSILTNYIFATMKRWRTFEGVRNSMTIDNNVNRALTDYITKNVLNRYKFTRVELFLKSVDLLSNSRLKYDAKYNDTIELIPNSVFSKFQTITDANNIDIRLIFYQPESSQRYSFDYYFNLYFEKI